MKTRNCLSMDRNLRLLHRECPLDNEPMVRFWPTNIVQNPSFPYLIPPFLFFLTTGLVTLPHLSDTRRLPGPSVTPPHPCSPAWTRSLEPLSPTRLLLPPAPPSDPAGPSKTTPPPPKYPEKPFSEKTPFILVFSRPGRTFAVLKMSSNGKS